MLPGSRHAGSAHQQLAALMRPVSIQLQSAGVSRQLFTRLPTTLQDPTGLRRSGGLMYLEMFGVPTALD